MTWALLCRKPFRPASFELKIVVIASNSSTRSIIETIGPSDKPWRFQTTYTEHLRADSCRSAHGVATRRKTTSPKLSITVRSLCIFSQCHFITSRGQNASSRITSYRIGIFNRGHLNDAQHESNHMIEIIRYARPDRYSNAMHSISILRTERWTSRKLVTCRQLTVTQASCDVGQARLLGFLVNQMQDRTDHAL